jgi:DNA mismatch endonuclease (patch repair protein)
MTRSDARKPRKTPRRPKTPKSKSSYAAWPDVPEARRRTMSAIQSRDTQPELLVRGALHARGYRFVVARRVAGYRPDVLFTRRRKAIFVHGCFWHGHTSCGRDRMPRTRADYWRGKIEGNKQRDARAVHALESAGWRTLVLWECEIGSGEDLVSRLAEFLGPPRCEAVTNTANWRLQKP